MVEQTMSPGKVAEATSASTTTEQGVFPDRSWDFLLVFGAIFLIAGAIHINQMLFAGDWSFWTDWKDRQWWPLIAPIVAIIIPAALQYITAQLDIPFGATLGIVVLMLVTWLSRVTNFSWWSYFPVNFVWPETFLPAAIILDIVFLWTKSFTITSALGGLLWGLLFQAQNWPLIAPFWQPVIYNGALMTVADLQGFMYIRTQTPEYLRIVELGHLRAFLQQISYVIAFFAGMVSMALYWFPGMLIGRFLAVWPMKVFLRQT